MTVYQSFATVFHYYHDGIRKSAATFRLSTQTKRLRRTTLSVQPH
ncbi:hypothetical protein ENTCAN_08476 [Enterobacter cancerogenus ATCC 35316]|nr:hypothetical protein ENTCAN_08476 [Enterobacter cancerogenus ATCC 35316]